MQYLEMIRQQAVQVREALDIEQRRRYEEQQRLADEASRQELDAVASRLHHLLSTASTSGVYSSSGRTGPPTVRQEPVEDIIRRARRKNMQRSNSPSRCPLARNPSIHAASRQTIREKQTETRNTTNTVRRKG
eukprot:GHVT01080653.1.p1 GENE.GHVT01080653.1~~GHVT01080653.1.p1  ORF type:complete len:133 (-),score=23.23 GHVT01080653.1:388-786(-)